jgi:hypothetical protein
MLHFINDAGEHRGDEIDLLLYFLSLLWCFLVYKTLIRGAVSLE